MELKKQFKNIENFKELEKENLDKLSPTLLHSESKFEYAYCRDGFHGKKQELIMRYVYFESMNISNLNVNEKTVFNNCIFENVKFKKCKFSNAIFINCKFINSSIIECSLPGVCFVNCIGLEETQIIDNILPKSSFYGSTITEAELRNNSNEIRDIGINEKSYNPIIEEKKEVQEENKSKDKERIEVEEDMEQVIINKKTYEDKVFTEYDLKNKLFNNCNFLSCKIDEKISMKANTDFIKCNFENMIFPDGKYDKVAFDGSTFGEVIFIGDFMKCNFARCSFESCTIDKEANFYTCNFDFSNAYEQFKDYQEQFTDVILNVESEETNNNVDEIYELMKPVYKHLKQNDLKLQEELELLRNKPSLSDESVDQYLLSLSDIEFMKFMSRITLKRTQEVTDIKATSRGLFTGEKVI